MTMRSKAVLLFLFVGILLFQTKASIIQERDSLEDYSTKASINGRYIKSYWLDTRDYFTAPLHWKAREFAIAGGVIGGVALLTTQDLKIQKWAQQNRSHLSDSIAKFGLEPWGSGYYSMGLMGVYYLQGLIFKNERSKKTAMLGVKAYIISGVLVNIPKMLLNRRRPYQGDAPDPTLWMGPFAGKFYKSMPSGHTTAAFAVATIVACEYSDKWYVPVLAYGIAGLTGLSRINDNRHWASDVLAGAAFGWSIGKIIHSRNNWKVNIAPYSTGNETGMIMQIPIR